jgi:hypothetical protein
MKNYIPVLEQKKIPNLVGTAKLGVSMQSFTAAMPAGGVIVFATNDVANMADGTYQVLIHNQDDQAASGTVAASAKLATQITVVGPTAADVLDIVLVGTLANQVD